jgi:protein-S-isoprenylcysteine O-methyltransferase Ste14
MRDRLGLAFFSFAAALSGLAAFEHPSLLAWVAVFHNAFLAAIYARRKPAQKYDRKGLWLGLLAGVLPLATSYPTGNPLPSTIFGLLGYGLILWSLLTLGARFGIAPADRGLVNHGPYRWVRHPMYLGELILRSAILLASPELLSAVALVLVLGGIQVMRARREERILAGYAAYASQVRYSLIPGVW